MDLNSSVLGSYSSFASLPSEILTQIFIFLNYEALQAARLVCKTWYLASLAPLFVHMEKVVIDFEEEDESSPKKNLEKLDAVASCSRDFYHLELKNKDSKDSDDIGKIPEDFWKKSGHRWFTLSIHQGSFPVEKLFSALTHCPKLKQLNLEGCVDSALWDSGESPWSSWVEAISSSGNAAPQNEGDQDNTPKFPTIETLQIDYAYGMINIINHTPNLRTLELLMNVTYGDEHTNSALAFVMKYMQQNPRVTLELRMDSVGDSPFNNDEKLFDEIFVELISLPNVHLKEYCTNYLPESMLERPQPWLDTLRLDTVARQFHSDTFKSICSTYPNMEKFSLANCPFGPTTRLRLPEKLTDLTLDFDGPVFEDEGVTEAQLLAGLCHGGVANLKRLKVKSMPEMTSLLVEFAKSHPNLTHLHLDDCGFSDRAMQAVIENLVSLQNLCVVSNSKISDAGLAFDKVDEKSSSRTRHNISRLSELQKLALVKCDGINGDFLEGVTLPKIQTIRLEGTKVPVKALKWLVENNPTIEELKVRGSKDINEDFRRFAAEKLPKLKSFVTKA